MEAMHPDVDHILFTEEEITAMVKRVGAQISEDYKDKDLVLIAVLRGAVVFMGDLMRAIDCPLAIDFMAVSSYGDGAKSSGIVRIVKDLDIDIKGRDVLIVEDILDSGITLNYLVNYLSMRNPASIRICTLLDKPDRRVVDVNVDYVGFVIPDEFVVGYGLDYDQKYRNLPYIGFVEIEE